MERELSTYIIKTAHGPEWIAEYPSLPGVLGTGVDEITAIEDLKFNASAHIEALRRHGSQEG